MGHCIVLVKVSDKVMVCWLVTFSVCMFGSVSVYLMLFWWNGYNWIQMSTFLRE